MGNLKSAFSTQFGRHIPGTKETQQLLETMAASPMGKDMLIHELQGLWLIMDGASSQAIALKYRRLYGDTLRQLGAKPPRAATVSARPITREEFEAVTGTDEA